MKEIGIRKFLGASVWQVVKLISPDFTKLLAIAFCVAFPVGWGDLPLAGDVWRSYPVNGGLFTLAGFIALAMAFFTVNFHVLKGALANPVVLLKNQ